jgi:AcrR family transcriptional regulator
MPKTNSSNATTTSSETKTQKIIACARKLFADNGFEKTTMEGIARAVPVSKATLYAAFPSKEDILLNICESHCESLRKMMLAVLDKTVTDYLVALRTMIISFLESIYCESSSVRSPEMLIYVSNRVKARAFPLFADIKHVIRTALQKAIANGEIAPDRARTLDLDLITEVIACAMTPHMPPYQRVLSAPQDGRPDKQIFDSEVAMMLDLLIAGIKGA